VTASLAVALTLLQQRTAMRHVEAAPASIEREMLAEADDDERSALEEWAATTALPARSASATLGEPDGATAASLTDSDGWVSAPESPASPEVREDALVVSAVVSPPDVVSPPTADADAADGGGGGGGGGGAAGGRPQPEAEAGELA
jgi:hypothetical protein